MRAPKKFLVKGMQPKIDKFTIFSSWLIFLLSYIELLVLYSGRWGFIIISSKVDVSADNQF